MRSERFLALTAAVLTCVAGCGKLRARAGADAGASVAASAEPASTAVGSNDAPVKGLDLSGLGAESPAPAKSVAKGTPPPAPAATTRNPADLERAFKSFDINQDDQLDGVEVTNCGCRAADANGNGEISKAEYLAAYLVVRPGQTPPSPPPPVASGTTAPPPSAPTTASPPSTPATTPPAPAQQAGITPGRYPCSGLVGGVLSTLGEFRILSPTTYTVQGGGVQRYSLDPATNKITWQSGLYADGSKFRDATYTPEKHLVRMRGGKDGFTTWNCRLDGKLL